MITDPSRCYNESILTIFARHKHREKINVYKSTGPQEIPQVIIKPLPNTAGWQVINGHPAAVVTNVGLENDGHKMHPQRKIALQIGKWKVGKSGICPF